MWKRQAGLGKVFVHAVPHCDWPSHETAWKHCASFHAQAINIPVLQCVPCQFLFLAQYMAGRRTRG